MSSPGRFTDAPDHDNAEALTFLTDRDLSLSGVVLGIFDQSDDCIKLLDVEGRLQFMNCNGRQATIEEWFQIPDAATCSMVGS